MGEGGSGRGQRASTEEGALTRVCGGDGRPVGRGQCKERCSIDGGLWKRCNIDGVCGDDRRPVREGTVQRHRGKD